MTKEVIIPQVDLSLVTGTLYELDVNDLRLWCKDWEDNSDGGITHERTNDHFTEYTVAGVTYARAIIFLPPYNFTFEDGQYSVRLTGANTNLFDVENRILNQNQVQLIPSNSAGLIVVTQGSGVTEQDKIDIIEGAAAAVFEEQTADHKEDGSYGAELATKDDIAASSSDISNAVWEHENAIFIKDIEGGRWKRDGTQMIFYKADNVTEVARFDLKKFDGTPATESDDEVAERVRVTTTSTTHSTTSTTHSTTTTSTTA